MRTLFRDETARSRPIEEQELPVEKKGETYIKYFISSKHSTLNNNRIVSSYRETRARILLL